MMRSPVPIESLWPRRLRLVGERGACAGGREATQHGKCLDQWPAISDSARFLWRAEAVRHRCRRGCPGVARIYRTASICPKSNLECSQVSLQGGDALPKLSPPAKRDRLPFFILRRPRPTVCKRLKLATECPGLITLFQWSAPLSKCMLTKRHGRDELEGRARGRGVSR